jgi:MFS family permease
LDRSFEMNTELNHSIKPRFAFYSSMLFFLNRQQRDWKVTVVRTSLDKLAYQMVFPYLSIYIVALGATATQLGMVNSIGMIIASFFSLLVGWFIDNSGPKKIYLSGISMLIVSYFIYGMAARWTITIFAMIAYWLGFSVSIQSCAVICGNCLPNQDRATGMTICETVAAGLLGMAGPMLGAWLVTTFGGVNTDGIRPLFFFAMAISTCTFFLVYTQLSNRKWNINPGSGRHLFSDLYSIMKEGRYLKRWLIIASLGNLPLGMIFPFSQVFANEVKGANEFVLGAMVTGASLGSIVLSIPLGRLADRIGRKRVLYWTIPLFWFSNIILVLASSPFWLVTAGILQGFYWIGGPIAVAMERELVPTDRMGRWLGITRCFRMLFNAAMAFLAGIIWDKIGPQYVFLTFIALEFTIRMPLLITMPETLNFRLRPQSPASPAGVK